MDPGRECLGLAKAEILEKQIAEYREQARSTHEKLYDRIRELEKSEAARDEQYKQIIEKLNKLISWQEDQQAQPGKRWNSVVEKAIIVVVTALVTFGLARLGLAYKNPPLRAGLKVSKCDGKIINDLFGSRFCG